MSQRTLLIGAALLATMLVAAAHAADSDSRAAREREMLRRAQEALRQSEADKSELTRAKLDAEQKLKALSQELESARSGSKAGQAALRAQLQSAGAAQADLRSKLEEAGKQLASLTLRQRETAGQLATRESEIKQLQQDLQNSKAVGASCEAKNLKLFEYSQELLDGYRKKGVWTSLTQKEPVFGLREVGIENVVQEYRDKLASQKIIVTPTSVPSPSPNDASPPVPKVAH
jgi:multidrug efflux pump subunit AcrA (membrane-fusion protein)